eukprot:Polyplicarium_translucidae@DN913_c0_g1_i1.p1
MFPFATPSASSWRGGKMASPSSRAPAKSGRFCHPSLTGDDRHVCLGQSNIHPPDATADEMPRRESERSASSIESLSFADRVSRSFLRVGRERLDRTKTFPKSRWVITLFLIAAFAWRIYTVKGFYIVSYILAIYILNSFVGFVTPQSDVGGDGLVLPVSGRGEDEFRPFQRVLPEFQCWVCVTRTTTLCSIATLFPILDLPVYWPLLFFYFIVLFTLTLKQQIASMLRHRYVPFSTGKRSYGSITRSPTTTTARRWSFWKSRRN